MTELQGTALWTAAEADAATGGQSSATWEATGVSIDSRTITPGDLFIAIEGPNNDGHDYVAEALTAGAAAAVVSCHPQAVSAEAPLLRVENTSIALQALGVEARTRTSAHIIAITGSVGKTSTKEALRQAFEDQAATHASQASYNNQWGVPLSLARMRSSTEFGVFELGMNHPGELEPLSRMVRPHAAIITCIAPSHLAYFRNVAEIASAKAEIFCGLEQEGIALLNCDDEFFPRLAEAAEQCGARRVLGFGCNPEAWAHAVSIVMHPTKSEVRASIGGRMIEYTIGAAGEHWVMNSLATLAMVAAFGGDLDRAAACLVDVTPLHGRGKRHLVRIGSGAIEVIDESYNANPASMNAAIATLGNALPNARGRRVAVLGDMLELGPDAPRLHAQLAEYLINSAVDVAFTTGTNMVHLDAALPQDMSRLHADRSRDLVKPLLELVRPGDVVMVKGSLGSRMGVVIEALLEMNEFNQRAECG